METCKTLGADKPKKNLHDRYFKFSYCPNELILIYAFTKKKQSFEIVNDKQISKVIRRVNELKENDIDHYRHASYYTPKKWTECDLRNCSPYIAKLILDVFPTETIERILYENQE